MRPRFEWRDGGGGMESFKDCLARVQLMSEGSPTWDLSDNDQFALKTVLLEIIHLREAKDSAREKVAQFILARGIATGHGDTIDGLLGELGSYVDEQRSTIHRLTEAMGDN